MSNDISSHHPLGEGFSDVGAQRPTKAPVGAWSKLKFTIEDDELLVDPKENEIFTGKENAEAKLITSAAEAQNAIDEESNLGVVVRDGRFDQLDRSSSGNAKIKDPSLENAPQSLSPNSVLAIHLEETKDLYLQQRRKDIDTESEGRSAIPAILFEDGGMSTSSEVVRAQKRKIRVDCVMKHCLKDFSGKAEMLRHVDEYHGEVKRCTANGCSYTTKRLHRLRDHKEKKHSRKGGFPDILLEN